jgi:hypothetical protein
LIQASSSATPTGGTLTPIRIAPTGGRPIRFFLLSEAAGLTIDYLLTEKASGGKVATCGQ